MTNHVSPDPQVFVVRCIRQETELPAVHKPSLLIRLRLVGVSRARGHLRRYFVELQWGAARNAAMLAAGR